MAPNDPPWGISLDTAFGLGPDDGIVHLDQQCRVYVIRYIKRLGRGFFEPSDLLDVYQETLIGVLRRAKLPGFDPSCSIRMVFTIARNKAIDLLRRRGHRINQDSNSITAVIDKDTRGSETLKRWNQLSPSETKELREHLLNFIATLPEQQRLVAQCFIDNFEDFRPRNTYQPLAEAVSGISQTPETVESVRSAWRSAREKIVEALHRLGYDWLQ